jgi:hypothetical protein
MMITLNRIRELPKVTRLVNAARTYQMILPSAVAKVQTRASEVSNGEPDFQV